MIRIKINGENLRIYDFDDGLAVLRRYVIKLGQNPQPGRTITTLPAFLRFKIEPSEFKEGESYQVTDVRDELKGLSIIHLTSEETIVKLQARYPLVNKRSIALLWLIVNDYFVMSQEKFVRAYDEGNFRHYLQLVYRRGFINARLTYEDLQKYAGDVKDKWEDVKQASDRESVIYDSLQKAAKPPIDDFDLEETIEETFLRLPGGESLYDVFDAMNVSRHIPYATLVDYGQTFVKVFSDIPPPDEWVVKPIPPNTRGIYFYVLDSPVEKLLSRDVQLEKLYSPGLWTDGNTIRLSLKLNSDETPEDLRKKILGSLGTRIAVKIDETMQMGVKGKFSIPEATFNRAVFADLILNNPAVSYFLFLDESEKTSLKKPRFTFYYEPNQQGEFATSLTVTVTPIVTEDDVWINIRVARAMTLKQVKSFMVIFQRIFGLYMREHDALVKQYEDLYKDVNFGAYFKKPPKIKPDKKTGRRLVALKKHNPEAFIEGYSSKCQPRHRQPYLVAKSGLETLKKDLKKSGGEELEDAGILNWPRGSDEWYACYPRDADEIDKRYIWPGVIKQNESAANFADYPFLPCCFLHNQYTKKGGNLVKYLAITKEEEGDDDNGKEFDETIFDRPLGEKKLTPRGRFAELPYYMQIVVGSAGYKLIEDKRKKFLPILRHGVIRGPDSFVHALEKATNVRYSSMSIENKKKHVRKVLRAIAGLENFTVGRQEMFDMTDDEIREHLATKGAYIDPDMYVSIFEKYYKCNIVLFQVNDDSPDGELVVPRHSVVYLNRKVDPKKRTVVIVKFGVLREWQYQCELVVKYNKGRLEYIFENDKLIDLIVKLAEEINTVYITSTAGKYRKYIPTIEL